MESKVHSSLDLVEMKSVNLCRKNQKSITEAYVGRYARIRAISPTYHPTYASVITYLN